jgi:hypothetical protein
VEGGQLSGELPGASEPLAPYAGWYWLLELVARSVDAGSELVGARAAGGAEVWLAGEFAEPVVSDVLAGRWGAEGAGALSRTRTAVGLCAGRLRPCLWPEGRARTDLTRWDRAARAGRCRAT